MNYEQFVSVGRDTIQSILFTTTPILLATLLVGLIIGIFQAATSINEATLTFVPKLLVIVIVLILAGPFMLDTMTGFFRTIFSEISRVSQ
ncbi:MAG: flagellar biosynthetic protein FliQ [Alphaproteobacteria bacterium]|jgi:flagellar biosynthetic protein FliQ|nr:flagellar biosynthetic protein FliQ [Alphaproteobacteria bacterium]